MLDLIESPETMEAYQMIFEEFLHELDGIVQKRYSEIVGTQINPSQRNI